MSTWPRAGARRRRRRGLLALLAALLGLGVLLMHTQLVDVLPAGPLAASTPASSTHRPAVMPTPAGPGSLAQGHTAVAPTAVAPSARPASATQMSGAVAVGLPGLPHMPAIPSMPGMHAGGLCVAVLGVAVGLGLLVGLLLAAADPAGTSRRLAASTGRSPLSRAATRRVPWRQALTPAELCLLRT